MWATQYAKEVIDGKYKVVDTEALAKWVGNEKMVIVDTMPDWSFDSQIAATMTGKTANGHIPGAINQEVSMNGGMTATQKSELIKKVNAQLPDKTVLTKVTKAKYKKLAKANRTTKKVKGKTVYYKKTVTKDKSCKIVVYCGWVKCDRSHQGAAYLVSKGYTNVYRYGGGIDAWRDKGLKIEGLAD